MTLVKRTSKNQLTLPKEIADAFEGITCFDATRQENKIVLAPVQMVAAGGMLESVRQKMKELGIGEKDVLQAVEWARKKRRSK